MASLALIVSSTTHAATTNTKASLERAGHAITLITDIAAETADFSSYAALVTARSGVTPSLLRARMQAGQPLLVGLTYGGPVGSGQSHTITWLRLAGTCEMSNGSDFQQVVSSISHPITTGYTVGQILAIHSSQNYGQALDIGAVHRGVALLTGDPGGTINGQVSMFACETGILDLDNVAIGARVVYYGSCYGGQGAYTTAGDKLLADAVTWLLASATINTPPAAPAVTITAITTTTADLTPGAYSDPNGDARTDTEYRVRRTSDNAIIWGPLAIGTGMRDMKTATGLPEATTGLVGEVRDRDAGGWGTWGTSTAFATATPASPLVAPVLTGPPSGGSIDLASPPAFTFTPGTDPDCVV